MSRYLFLLVLAQRIINVFLSSERLCFVSFYTFKKGNYLLTTLTKDSRNAKRCTNNPGNHSTKSKKINFFFDGVINDIIIYLKKDNVCQIFLQQVDFFSYPLGSCGDSRYNDRKAINTCIYIYSLHQGNIVDKRSRQRVMNRHMLIRKIEHTYCTGELKSLPI